MFRILTNSVFWGDVFIRGRRLLEGGAYFDLSLTEVAFISGGGYLRHCGYLEETR